MHRQTRPLPVWIARGGRGELTDCQAAAASPVVRPPAPHDTTRQYLFIFLKFVQSVIPTVDFDFTIEIEGR